MDLGLLYGVGPAVRLHMLHHHCPIDCADNSPHPSLSRTDFLGSTQDSTHRPVLAEQREPCGGRCSLRGSQRQPGIMSIVTT